MKKKAISLFIISIIILSSVAISTISEETVASNPIIVNQENDVVIPNPLEVPYVSQETGFFCSYASNTIVFQYYNIDTTLEEVLYYSGVGYSSYYTSTPFVFGGYGVCQSSNDSRFLGELFGLSFNISISDNWNQYWINAKENISYGIPVITTVNPFNLPLFDFNNEETKYKSAHGIVIVGYNESNQTVCYNDPAAEIYEKNGYHVWININDFKEAVENTLASKYLIATFVKVSDPLPEEEAFELAHERNIERLKGNIEYYNELLEILKSFIEIDNIELGVHASESLKEDFGRGFNNRIKTIFVYRLMSKQYKLQKIINIFNFYIQDIPLIQSNNLNHFNMIAIEKQYTAEYLNSIDNEESQLFDQEAEYWFKLSDYYNKFMKRHVFLPGSIYLINRMKKTMDDIISIENEIIQ